MERKHRILQLLQWLTVDALQFFEKYGEVCPANWSEGDKAMKPDQDGLVEYFSE